MGDKLGLLLNELKTVILFILPDLTPTIGLGYYLRPNWRR